MKKPQYMMITLLKNSPNKQTQSGFGCLAATNSGTGFQRLCACNNFFEAAEVKLKFANIVA